MAQKITVLGGGESGVGAALLARQKGLDVFLSEKGAIRDAFKEELAARGIPYEEGRHSRERLFGAGEIVKSPGIPDQLPLIRELREAGLPVISEIEFAGRYTDATLIGITGSNGKTTTTKLTHHLLQTAGIDAGMAGNVGISFARALTKAPHAYYVLELSSFQLDGIEAFRPRIAALLNITPDHLDRYDYQMANYIRSKFRIIRNQGPGDVFLYNEDNENVTGYLKDIALTPTGVGLGRRQIDGAAILVDGERYDLSRTVLQGRHNAMNALFAVTIARLLQAAPAAIREGLHTFISVPHRLEPVAEIDGVLYLNDSKATNVDSVFFALDAMTRPIVWIAGGQDKGNDYEPLLPLARDKVKAIVCLGRDNAKIAAAFAGSVDTIEETDSAEAAVRAAARLAEPGDVVLLSPACASFDLFRNFEDRGEQFKAAVRTLQNNNRTTTEQ